ncbi:MAG: response regulator [Polyangiaceae bacterium]|nr:response regulator [Polyangiaceae bacterium]
MPTSVLFVDDEPMNRTLLPLMLGAAFEVTACANGAEALAAFDAGTFELVVLDVMMPPPDGVEICRLLRARGYGGPVLFMSGWPDAATRERAKAAGGDAFLARPFGLEELERAVAELLQRPP